MDFSKFKKYRIVNVLLVASLLCCSGLKIEANNKLVIALDWYINPDHAPLLVAQQKELFKKRGLDVEFITPTDASIPSRLVAIGKIDMALIFASQYIANNNAGLHVNYITTLINKSLACMATLKKNSIKNLANLKHKKIGYCNDGTENVVLKTMLDHNGLHLEDVLLIDIKMNLTQALLSGKVDAVYGMMRNVEPVQLAQMGAETKLFYPEENGVPDHPGLIIVSKKGLSQKIVKDFTIALQEAVQYLKKNPEQAWSDVLQKYHDDLAISPRIEKSNHLIWKETIKYFDPNPANVYNKEIDNYAKFFSKFEFK